MCDCNELINQQLSSENTKLSLPILLNTNLATASTSTKVVIATEKADKKIKKKAITIFASYCPFCGEKYQE